MLELIAKDPQAFILKQGWASVSLDGERGLMELRSLYEHLQARILEMIESLDELRASAEMEIFREVEQDEEVIDRISAAQREELELEIGGLQDEADRVAQEARELAAGVPFGWSDRRSRAASGCGLTHRPAVRKLRARAARTVVCSNHHKTPSRTAMAAKIYTTKDAKIAPLKKKTLAVIGFGSQGHAHALNLKDSGLKVIIGLYKKSKSREVAKKLGFEVMDTADAVKAADVIFVATPDTVIPAVYNKDIAPNLTKGKTLLFSHGFAVHFKTIKLPKDIDVILVAPKGPGHTVRSQFVAGKGVPGLIAIHQDVTGKAKETALAWSGGIGCARAGVFETNFREETVTDLFGEQVVLCGGATALVKAGFETLVEAGYQPEMAYFECLHELKLIVDMMNEQGIAGMRFSVSETAEWGDVSVGPKIIDASVKKRMKQQLKEIESGKFAKEWIAEYEGGYKRFNAIRKAEANHPIEKVGAKLRSTMSWIKQSKIKKGAAQASLISSSK